MADPNFFLTGSIDLLIGGGIFFDLLEPKRIPLGMGSICLQDTKLGWVITGEIGSVCLLNISSTGKSLEEDWKTSFMDNDMYGRSSKANLRCLEEELTVQHFKNTVTRNNEGRFVLKLPIKPDSDNLGNSLVMATSRFIGIERRLQRDEGLRIEYSAFMKEYLDMGHMKEVTGKYEIPKRVCYLPHHAVLKTTNFVGVSLK